MDLLLVAAGLVLLFFGGEFLVRGSVALAHRLGISTLVIALTVVAFGTSSPELIVSVGAALRGVPELAIGNIVGSNIANVFLVLGLPAIIAPLGTSGKSAGRDLALIFGASVVLAADAGLPTAGHFYFLGAMMVLALALAPLAASAALRISLN